MSMTEIENARHARERGDILLTLKEDYLQAMTSVRNLLGAMDAQGMSLSEGSLCFHLQYLKQSGYIQLWRHRDLDTFRTDRRGGNWVKPDAILFAKLLPKGLQLIDGKVEEDPLVAF